MTTKSVDKEYNSLEKSKPRAIRHKQHQEELVIIKPFAFFDSILKRYCKLSSLTITIEPCFRALTQEKLTIRVVDGRYNITDPLREYCKIETSATESHTWIISDFPTVPKSAPSPYRVEIETKVSGVKFGQILCYMRIIPTFFYTNRSEQPSKVSVQEVSDGELKTPVTKETLFRSNSSIRTVHRTIV
ncbi:TPA_asm: P3 [Bemisia tabaci-associated virus 1]|uniref:P3 n=1 Tax=Bemisia tabaci-associated virus 1 TaxID=3070198 RepID=A0A8D9PH12_9RHAB|nr:P3 [Bemisia tabaci-associated virus 1]DAF42317.1 TPA_asm: P3 [Bemisia tabaci-associated virus 1]